jgi:uncharacterized coiled-coil protein SlyX
MAVKSPTTAQLRGRIAELEAQLAAREQVIVTLAARIRELEGGSTAAVVERAHRAETELLQLRSTKVMRLTAGPRQVYGRLRRIAGG